MILGMHAQDWTFENGYGRVHRSACLIGVRERVPGVAVLAAAQWQARRTTVWQRVNGSWRESYSSRGGWQGARLMQILFCFGLDHSLSRVPMLSAGSPVSRVAYQDDLYLVGPARAQDDGWDDLERILAADRHRLRADKSKTWIPLLDENLGIVESLAVRGLTGRIRRVVGGLPLLGGVAQGTLETY